jgi:hypothetical protein
MWPKTSREPLRMIAFAFRTSDHANDDIPRKQGRADRHSGEEQRPPQAVATYRPPLYSSQCIYPSYLLAGSYHFLITHIVLSPPPSSMIVEPFLQRLNLNVARMLLFVPR